MGEKNDPNEVGYVDDSALKIPKISYKVIATYPHDEHAFTQGLSFRDGTLFESTGNHEARSISTLRQVEISTGRILRSRALPSQYNAEGLVIVEDKVYQLTYLGHKGFVYDLETFDLLDSFRYEGEGWGLTFNGRFLVMSDGSHQLRLIDPKTLQVQGETIDVLIGGSGLNSLNELEHIGGHIYANVWMTDNIFRINPSDGQVNGRLDLKALRPTQTRDCIECVLNGIAYDEKFDSVFVTGKNWPKLYEIRLDS